MKIRAICDWADCWIEAQEFEVQIAPNGLAFIYCNDGRHWVDNGAERDLTPADIAAGKSTQFVCVEA